MEIIKLTASRRTEAGKGPSRRLRREGKIPAITYGMKHAPLPIAVSPKELKAALSGPHGRNTVIELSVSDGGSSSKFTALVKEYAHHPVSREIVHADFTQIDLAQPVDVNVPFKLTGKCVGVVAGGVLGQIYRALPIRSLPEKIPSLIELDVTDLELGASKKASDVKLPEGVTIRLAPEQTVAVVAAPDKRGEAEDAAAAAAGAAKAAAAPGAAAAPAAAAGGPASAKAPAAKADDKKKK
jgi:large subunit ribosomal protein L25